MGYLGKKMGFERNETFDKLIVEANQNFCILENLDYEELILFQEYLINLNKKLTENGGNK